MRHHESGHSAFKVLAMSKVFRPRRRGAGRARSHSVLDSRTFAIRHRFVLVLAWAHVPTLAATGLLLGAPVSEVAIASLTLIALLTVGTIVRNRALAAASVAFALITASGLLIYLTDGVTASHFHFFVVVTAVSFYRDWRILAVAVSYVVAYQFSAGLITMTESQPDAVVEPVWWATIHSGAVVLLALILMAGWKLTARTEDMISDGDLRYRLSFEEAPVGMALIQPSGSFLQVNLALANLIGYDISYFPGRNVRSLIHRDDLGLLGDAWEEMGNGTSHHAAVWLRCLTSHGHTVWARASLSLVPWSVDQPAIVVLALEDGTHSHVEQRRLESLIAGRDEFVAQVSDEMREPLDNLLELAGGRDDSDLLRRIERLARDVSSMVDDLMVSARPDIPVVARPLDAGALCREVLTVLPGARAIRLDIDSTALWADPGLTRQAVTNLVDNAVRYGGPNVRIHIVRSGPDTVIQVSDDGPEVPETERERLFDGGLQSGPPATRPASVGLSLAVARQLALRMDGDIVYRRTGDRRNQYELRLPSEQITVIEKPRLSDEQIEIPA
jgi:PAS domain S-box-containing protein